MKHRLFSAIFTIILLMTACAPSGALFDVSSDEQAFTETSQTETKQVITEENTTTTTHETSLTENTTLSESTSVTEVTTTESAQVNVSFTLDDIPPLDDSPYYVVNDNIPFFTPDEIIISLYEFYPNLDELGRCGACIACISLDMMPTAEREGIGMIKPSGWQISKYDFVEGKYLYNRCHLIGYQLTGENANLSNLITGTRYMNTQGMLPFENKTAEYIRSTGNHVMYRVTPVFEGNNLVATGVLMEGLSVEDSGQGLCFNVFCYNSQPGVGIDYATGDNWLDTDSDIVLDTYVEEDSQIADDRSIPGAEDDVSQTYILNKNTKKIHYPWCSSVEDMAEHNKQEFTGNIDEVIEQGYSLCKRCNPT